MYARQRLLKYPFMKKKKRSRNIPSLTQCKISCSTLTGAPLVPWLMLLSPPWSCVGFSYSLITDSLTTEIAQISQTLSTVTFTVVCVLDFFSFLCFYAFETSRTYASCFLLVLTKIQRILMWLSGLLHRLYKLYARISASVSA